jgi:carbonic anhydrase
MPLRAREAGRPTFRRMNTFSLPRSFVLLAGLMLSLSLGGGCLAAPDAGTPGETLTRLQAGNARFVAGRLEHPNLASERRSEMAQGQRPSAVILTCADSRVPPELVFDQGLGDLFVVRVAGNVLNDQIIGSIEYAVTVLGSRLVVVLGHESCGAVAAARDTFAAAGQAPGHIQSILESIRPAVEATRGQPLAATSLANVRQAVDLLRASKPLLQARVADGSLQVVGANYELESGAVVFDEAARGAK